MTGSFILDYYLLVLLASCGLFQVIAARNGVRGMLFFKHRLGSFIFGIGLFAAAFAWFFLSESRNVPDTALGLNGNEQFAYFFAGSGTGLALTLGLASVLNWSLGKNTGKNAGKNSGKGRVKQNEKDRGEDQHPSGLGLESLHDATYMRVLLSKLRCPRHWPGRVAGQEGGTGAD